MVIKKIACGAIWDSASFECHDLVIADEPMILGPAFARVDEDCVSEPAQNENRRAERR